MNRSGHASFTQKHPTGSISLRKDIGTPAKHRSASTSDGMPRMPQLSPAPALTGENTEKNVCVQCFWAVVEHGHSDPPRAPDDTLCAHQTREAPVSDHANIHGIFDSKFIPAC
ncbi:hypothetical protein B0H19DRAFT_1086378 [Mycena capillaripes]|nr:hypothetical protein B0H19DRAFT_1086378 [Mycena capillaripes]